MYSDHVSCSCSINSCLVSAILSCTRDGFYLAIYFWRRLVGKTYCLKINTVGNEATAQNLDRVSFALSSKDQPDPVHGASVIDKIIIPSFKISKKREAERWNHLSDVDLHEFEVADLMIFVEAGMAHLLIYLEVRQRRQDEPSQCGPLLDRPCWVM